MQKYKIDTKDPSTVDYNSICEFVAKSTSSKKAIQQLNKKKITNLSQKYKIKELANQVYIDISIPKKRKNFKILFRLIGILLQITTKSNKAIEELAKLFNQLNLNIRVLVQKTIRILD